jgi:hypothetical protein
MHPHNSNKNSESRYARISQKGKSLDEREPSERTCDLIAWCLGGVHDRAWKERAIYGKVRYTPMNRDNVSPNIWYYGLAVLIIFIGFAAFAGSIYAGITDAESSLLQITAPGGANLFLSEPGEYIIFYENNSFMNGKFYSTSEQIPGMEILVREKATGLDLATYPAKSSFTYSLGSRSGRSIMAFEAPRAGIYQINASYSGSAGPKVVLAIGKGMVEGIFSSIMISMAALLGSIAIAAVITFVTYSRRKKAFLRLKEDERIMRGIP